MQQYWLIHQGIILLNILFNPNKVNLLLSIFNMNSIHSLYRINQGFILQIYFNNNLMSTINDGVFNSFWGNIHFVIDTDLPITCDNEENVEKDVLSFIFKQEGIDYIENGLDEFESLGFGQLTMGSFKSAFESPLGLQLYDTQQSLNRFGWILISAQNKCNQNNDEDHLEPTNDDYIAVDQYVYDYYIDSNDDDYNNYGEYDGYLDQNNSDDYYDYNDTNDMNDSLDGDWDINSTLMEEYNITDVLQNDVFSNSISSIFTTISGIEQKWASTYFSTTTSSLVIYCLYFK